MKQWMFLLVLALVVGAAGLWAQRVHLRAAEQAQTLEHGRDAPATRPPYAVAEDATITWHDAARGRDIPVKVYIPKDGPGPCPVIIFSHGLGGSREGYAYLGRFWAGHGYVSVHLQHPGSDIEVLRTIWLRRALLKAAADRENWRDRPLDVSFAINQLEQANQNLPLLKGRLDLSRIGVAGHSYGAYTTLASVGMLVDYPLARDKSFRDPRIKAAIPMSAPGKMGGALDENAFSAIATPCLHMTGTKDGSPLLRTSPEERRIPYNRTPGPNQFLMVIQDAEHFAFSDNPRFPGQGKIERNPAHHEYIKRMSLTFWNAYLKGNAQAKQFLNSEAPIQDCDGQIEYHYRPPASE